MTKDKRMVRGLLVSALLALTGVGCSDPCDELKELCDACNPAADDSTGQGLKDTCNRVVAVDDSDTCDVLLDSKVYEGCK